MEYEIGERDERMRKNRPASRIARRDEDTMRTGRNDGTRNGTSRNETLGETRSETVR